ncbi:hypothetical protein H9P43_002885 [Blastocladiella emersonii ATCC 22665]|nr:hypothetical protein H9P43_002885 [Blastocladiella emersonii ATCC 22665]
MLGNVPMFYAIHLSAVLNGFASIVGCIAVLVHASSVPLPAFLARRSGGLFQAADGNRARRRDFSARFAVYLACADLIWHTSHIIDHTLLLVRQTYPPMHIAVGLGANLIFWFGYAQVLHLALSAYSYLKICRNINIRFGRHDWRLHAAAFGTVIFLTGILLIFDGFGLFAYWCLGNSGTIAGLMTAPMAFMTASSNALCTTLGHRAIQAKIDETAHATGGSRSKPAASPTPSHRGIVQSASFRDDSDSASQRSTPGASPLMPRRPIKTAPAAMLEAKATKDAADSVGTTSLTSGPASGTTSTSFSESGTGTGTGTATSGGGGGSSKSQRSNVATQCLNVLVRTASLTYIPLAVGAFAVTIECFLGVVEPISCLVVATMTNCAGWANAYAYFVNERLKLTLRKTPAPKSSATGSMSASEDSTL